MGSKKDMNLEKALTTFMRENEIEKVVVFGSYGRGDFSEQSDLDLILVSDKFEGQSHHERMSSMRRKIDIGKSVDIVCYTPEEFEEQKEDVTLVSHALQEGYELAA